MAAQPEDLMEEVPGEPLEHGGHQQVVEARRAGAQLHRVVRRQLLRLVLRPHHRHPHHLDEESSY